MKGKATKENTYHFDYNAILDVHGIPALQNIERSIVKWRSFIMWLCMMIGAHIISAVSKFRRGFACTTLMWSIRRQKSRYHELAFGLLVAGASIMQDFNREGVHIYTHSLMSLTRPEWRSNRSLTVITSTRMHTDLEIHQLLQSVIVWWCCGTHYRHHTEKRKRLWRSHRWVRTPRRATDKSMSIPGNLQEHPRRTSLISALRIWLITVMPLYCSQAEACAAHAQRCHVKTLAKQSKIFCYCLRQQGGNNVRDEI